MKLRFPIIILAAFLMIASVAKSHSPIKLTIYGDWKSDKPLFGNVVELNFTPGGAYKEVIKDAKTNIVKSTYEATFKLVNDTTIRIKSATAVDNHHLQFMNKNLLRFYPAKKMMGESVPVLYRYNFVRDKKI